VAIEQIGAGLVAWRAAGGAEPDSHPDAIVMVRELEAIGRQISAQQAAVVEAIDRRQFHRHDAHASAKVMDRHVARLSDLEAHHRFLVRRVKRELPTVWAAFEDGLLPKCHVDRIARALANPRVRARVIDNDQQLASLAAKTSYKQFDERLTDWIAVIDQDGTCDTSQRNHENRTASIHQDPDGSWRLAAASGSLDGAAANEIFTRFVDAEFQTDWEKARAEHGDATTAADLARTAGQRSHDAWMEILRQAAANRAAATGGSQITTTVVIDHATFERNLRRLFGQPTDIGQPLHVDIDGPEMDAYRCHTLDGHRIDPTEAVANALITDVRRAVYGADSVVIDLGRRSRLFRGPAALAARLGNSHCYWPGCHVPVSHCQIDHLVPWADPGSRTNPRNGGPACGRHNRAKEQGFTVHRDDAGTWHTHRPDGTEID